MPWRIASKNGLKVTGFHITRDGITVMTEGANVPASNTIAELQGRWRWFAACCLGFAAGTRTAVPASGGLVRPVVGDLPMPDAADFAAAYAAAVVGHEAQGMKTTLTGTGTSATTSTGSTGGGGGGGGYGKGGGGTTTDSSGGGGDAWA